MDKEQTLEYIKEIQLLPNRDLQIAKLKELKEYLINSTSKSQIIDISPYADFIKQRKYHTSGLNDKDEILKIYKENVDLGIKLGYNSVFDEKKAGNLRIMTWNVRYWTDYNDNPTIESIAKTIQKISPDILCLQEATIGYSKYYPVEKGEPVDIRTYLKDYELISFCNVVPSWYQTTYGNMILIKKELIEKVKLSEHTLFEISCDIDKSKCLFNQIAMTYDNPKPVETLQLGNYIDDFRNKETRCFIKISFSDFDIFCTHLEAYNKTVRREQLDQLAEHITRKSIILGDFNIIDADMYKIVLDHASEKENKDLYNAVEKEWNYIRERNSISLEDNDISYIRNELGWVDCYDNMYKYYKENIDEVIEVIDYMDKNKMKDFDKNLEFVCNAIKGIFSMLKESKYNLIPANMSVWTNVVVDYGFLVKDWRTRIENSYVHFNHYSDHLPIIIDISDSGMRRVEQRIKTLSTKSPQSSDEFKEISVDEFNRDFQILYNGQPLNAYNWYNLSTSKLNTNEHVFSDPYMTGNFMLKYGDKGVYIANTIKTAMIYMKMFQTTMVNNEKILINLNNTGLISSGLIFGWKIKAKSDPSIVIASDRVVDASDLDKKYDIIESNGIGKVTRKGIMDDGSHKIIELVFVKLVIKNNDDIRINIIDDTMDRDSKIKQIIDKIIPYEDRNKVDNYYKVFMNSLWYINKKNESKTGEKIINTNDINQNFFKYEIGDDKKIITYDLIAHFQMLKQKSQTGGIYLEKYKKYKTKYLMLKNGMR